MGIWQSIFRCLRSREEDEQHQQQQLHPFLDNNNNYRKPYNGGSFGSSSSFYTLFKNQFPWIFKFFPFAKSRKPEPILPIVNPTNNLPFLQIQDTSSSSSDSSSSLNTTYATPPDFQLQSDHYSSSEDEVHSTSTTSLKKPPVSSSMESGSNEDEGSYYIKQMDMIIDVPSFDYESLAHTSTSATERGSNDDKGSCHIKQMDVIINVPSFDYEPLARTNTSALERGSNEDEGSCHIKQMDMIIDVPSVDYQSLACTNTFDVVDSAVFSIKNEENEVEEADEEKVINHCVSAKTKGRTRGKRNKVKGKGVNEGKWITHYNSNHRILLVGEGDFSFSASLAVAFGYAPNMMATSLDSKEFLKESYRRAMSNIEKLSRSGCTVKHGIDATKIATPDLFGGKTFDRIIFNFPFAGFFKDLSREAQLKKHRRLVSLFLKNAKELIGENGEIHISHKTNGFHKEWMLESLASSHGLRLIEAVDFNRYDYKGYNTKCGFGSDNNFNCHPSKTYKFGLKNSSSSAY